MRCKAVVTGVVASAALVALVGVPVVWAVHETACNALPTSGERPGQVSFNPRQECRDAIPGHVRGPARDAANAACNRLGTSAQRPGMVRFNPRQECLAALPAPPSIGISSIEGGDAGGNKTHAGRADLLIVKGSNVGIPGNTVTPEGGGFTVALAPAPNCLGANCVGLAVVTEPNAEGSKTFTLRAAHGHSQARGTFQIVAAPPPARVELAPMRPAIPAMPMPTRPPAADAIVKVGLYKAFMAELGAGVSLRNLPQPIVEILAPVFPGADVRAARFGYADRQPSEHAVTDCTNMYFNSREVVAQLSEGRLAARHLNWVLHELRHTGQCRQVGGRDAYGKMWFDQLPLDQLRKVELNKDSLKAEWRRLHDAMPMEADAASAANTVEAELRRCCIDRNNMLVRGAR